jgi:tetratricopeptide (TPR) repeat protein
MKNDLEKAKIEYEKSIALTEARFWLSDIYAKSYYMLGKIHEQQGKKTKAREYYEKFLELWKNADPGLPEVDDARARLSSL